MNFGMVRYIVGFVILVEGIVMLIPTTIAAFLREDCQSDFLITMAVLCVVGILMIIKKPKSKLMYVREGFIAVTLAWIILSFFGAFPYYLSGAIPSFIDAFFETMSGFTTTGATILEDIEALPVSLLFWRSLTQWLGGMGVLILMLAVLPLAGGRTIFLMRAESSSLEDSKMTPKMRNMAMALYGIYISLTVLEVIFLLFGGMPLFDSITHAFSTAGTGGFSIKNEGVAYYNSAYINIVISVFMILFGVSFNVYFWAIMGRFKAVLKNEEFRWYLIIIFVGVMIIAGDINRIYGDFGESLGLAFFQTASTSSTTGFANADHSVWPQFSIAVTAVLMIIGGSTGSTSGGIKVLRIIIAVKNIGSEIRKKIHPRSVNTIRINGKSISSEDASSISMYLSTYFIILMLSFMVVSIDNKGFESTFFAVLNATINCDGVLKPINYTEFSILSKLVLCFDMLLGRLEFIPVLMMLSLSTWKREKSHYWKRRKQ